MQDKFYVTSASPADREEVFSLGIDGFCSEDPERLDDGILYRVTIEKAGVVRTTKEVEFDAALSEESD